MKRQSNLYNFSLNDVIDMTNKVLKRVKNKEKVFKFELYKCEHIINIYNRLNNNDLNIGKYNIFLITDPKCRVVMALDIEDKILNHLIAQYILNTVFESKYTSDMYATRIGRGTSYGIRRLKSYLNKIDENYYFLKLDISKYFYSISHDKLKEILNKKIKDKKALNMLYSIIDSTDYEYINKKIKALKNKRIEYLEKSNLKNKEKLIKEVKEIPLYKKGYGLSIGNQTSQSFGLIFLYELNHFIKEKLKIKYVCNYMDDFIIIDKDKEYLKYCLKEINIFLNNYNLKINYKKTKIERVKHGIDFLGYIFYKNNTKIKNKTKRKYYKNSKPSYKGLFKYCHNLYYKNIKMKIIDVYINCKIKSKIS